MDKSTSGRGRELFAPTLGWGIFVRLRSLLLGLLIGGLSLSSAHAQDEDEGSQKGWRPQFTASVPPDKMKAAFPKGATMSGRAMLGCAATRDGKLVDCKVLKEDPVGQGFGEAALSVVGYERIKTKDETGASVEGRPVRTSFHFMAPGDANPTWVRRPTGQDLANVFPAKAIDKGVGGRATIHCQVTVEGFLQNCKVVSEAPEGMGFGAAALQLTPQLLMKPMIRGGKAVPGGAATIPIIWEAPKANRGITLSTPVVLDPPWSQVPTQAEIKAAWPAEAQDLDSGQAALRCNLNGSGLLSHCDVISENPRNKGFGKAAKTLSKSFRVSADPADSRAIKKYTVDVPFRFRNPAKPDARKLTNPRWIRTLTAEGMAGVFPEAAVKAGVKSGKGAATCTVAANGELTACQTAREAPAGLDFGAAAVQAVSLMRMNPWTKEGDTVEGLTVTIPVTFSLEDDTADRAAKPETSPAPRKAD